MTTKTFTAPGAFLQHPTHPRFKDRTGQQYGYLVCVGYAGPIDYPSGRRQEWWMRCACGMFIRMSPSKQYKSCGCKRGELLAAANRTHGKSKTPLYGRWKRMHQRCYDTNCTDYADYGAKGIRVADPWHDFAEFYKDMGEPPYTGAELDRVDYTKNYGPDNVRWANRTQQANNTSANRLIEFKGETKTMADWARTLDVPYGRLQYRLDAGWSIEQAFLLPKLNAST